MSYEMLLSVAFKSVVIVALSRLAAWWLLAGAQNLCRIPACRPVRRWPLMSAPARLADTPAEPLKRKPALMSFFR